MSSSTFRLLLERMDSAGAMKAWKEWFPDMPQPKTQEEAEIVLHYARTVADSVGFNSRAYSHAWLTERRLPSGLPDHLKPRAQRMYPVQVQAVGISINFKNPFLKPAADQIRKVMETRVEECYAEGVTDPDIVKKHMLEAKEQEEKALFGGLISKS